RALSVVRSPARSRAVSSALRAVPLVDALGLVDRVAQRLRLREVLELLERVVLDLPDALTRDAERAADLLERPRRAAAEPEAQLDHLALALGQRAERVLDVLAPERELRGVERRLGRLVLDEVAERGLLFVADRLLQGDG